MLKHLNYAGKYNDFMSRIKEHEHQYLDSVVFNFLLIHIPTSFTDGSYNNQDRIINLDITDEEYISLCEMLEKVSMEYENVKDVLKDKIGDKFQKIMFMQMSVVFPDFFKSFSELRKDLKKYISRYYFDTTQVCGSFNVKSGKMYVADPCYDKSMKDCRFCLPVKNGKWNFTAYKEDSNGIGCSALEVCHEDFTNETDMIFKGYVSVDSAQAGFFCGSMYLKGEFKEWYEKILSSSCEKDKHSCIGVLENGVNSHSFYGDGGYPLYICKNDNNKVVKAKIVYYDKEN